MQTMTRNAGLGDLAEVLKDQHARKIDVVAPATTITSTGGMLEIAGADPVLEDNGVTITDGLYLPTRVCDEHIAEKLNIPLKYLRRMRESRIDLYDANVNGWLHGRSPHRSDLDHTPADERSFLVRCLRGDDQRSGIARAVLSDRYRVMDNLDVLMASLEGIRVAGVEVQIDGCDLSDRRMYVRVVCPQVQVLAEEFLKGYRNPFGDDFARWRRVADREGMGYGGEEPIVFAGLVIQNSEVGDGAYSITPRAVIRVCKNGLVVTADMMREVHIGGRLDEGVVDWSEETTRKAVELVKAKTRDAVTTFLSEKYLSTMIEQFTEAAGKPVESVDEVRNVTKSLGFTETQIDGILNRFIRGGQMTMGGVANAITAHAQLVTDPDEAHMMEERAAGVLT